MPAPYETTPPADNPQIARIMAERGVGRRRAYALARRENAAAIDTTDIPRKQSLTVMNILIHEEDSRRTAADLQRILHSYGFTLDMHDTTKTLWALQKMGWVRFYERNNKGLTSIKVTPEGYDGYKAALETNGVKTVSVKVDTTSLDAALDEAQQAVEEYGEKTLVTQSVPKWWKYPAINALMKRAEKEDKLQAAARLLEEAGEDDMALSVMAITGFNQLEKEVIDLIKEDG